MNRKGFTLVEIMIVVAIIALLAAIAIPNLLRARLSANDALAQSTLRAISTAAESFGTANEGNYPLNETSLTDATPAYMNDSYCGTTVSGYDYTCAWTTSSYSIDATPHNIGTSGTQTYSVRTGGILSP